MQLLGTSPDRDDQTLVDPGRESCFDSGSPVLEGSGSLSITPSQVLGTGIHHAGGGGGGLHTAKPKEPGPDVGQMWRQSPAATALSDDPWGLKGALVTKSKRDRRHSRVGRRPEDLSSMRCVLTCFSENTMVTPIKLKSRVWAVWVEAQTRGQLRRCKSAKKEWGGPGG